MYVFRLRLCFHIAAQFVKRSTFLPGSAMNSYTIPVGQALHPSPTFPSPLLRLTAAHRCHRPSYTNCIHPRCSCMSSKIPPRENMSYILTKVPCTMFAPDYDYGKALRARRRSTAGSEEPQRSNMHYILHYCKTQNCLRNIAQVEDRKSVV